MYRKATAPPPPSLRPKITRLDLHGDRRHIGHNITVSVNYTDGQGFFEFVTGHMNVTPTVAGDLSTALVKGSGHTLTAADLEAVDPDNSADELIYTVVRSSHSHLSLDGTTLVAGGTFSQADVNSGRVLLATDDTSYTGIASVTLALADSPSSISPVEATLEATIFDAQFTTLTSAGYSFRNDNSIEAMGRGRIQSGASTTSYTVMDDLVDHRKFVVSGTGFTYIANEGGQPIVTGGTITGILVTTIGDQPLFAVTTYVSAMDWMITTRIAADGDERPFQTLTQDWSIFSAGGPGPDWLASTDNNDGLIGGPGDDVLEGGAGIDRAIYSAATGPINVQLAAGTVIGDGSVGTDTLISVELIRGTAYGDTFNASGFGSISMNAGSITPTNQSGAGNEFEGQGGDDVITGNGSTRVSYAHATGSVTVNLAAGYGQGNASVGHDTFISGVNAVRGSDYADTLIGSNNTAANTVQIFDGRGGDDFIDGNGGFDRVTYASENAAISVDLAAGTVTVANGGRTDTLRSIESVVGTAFDDTYNAMGFTGRDNPTPSANAGDDGGVTSDFNEFEGGGGNDTINGHTRASYASASAGVLVTLTTVPGAGFAMDWARNNLGALFPTLDAANVGVDQFITGVQKIRGSMFNDFLTGNDAANTLEGQGGNDQLDGRAGDDTLIGGSGSDRFVYSLTATASNLDTVTDFSRLEGDRIDIRSTGITGFGGVSGKVSMTAVPGSTVITFQTGNVLTLQGFTGANNAGVVSTDFIYAGQIAISVPSKDGFDGSALYDQLAGASHAAHNANNYILVDDDGGADGGPLYISFSNNNGSFTYSGDTVTGGNFGAMAIYDSSYQVIAAMNGWNQSLTAVLSAVNTYASSHNAGALDAIFGAVSYSGIGASASTIDNNSVHFGGDTFVSGTLNDYFNGLTNSFSDSVSGDTVDYSHVGSAVTVNLSITNGTNSTGGGGVDTLRNIENLRGSNFNDTLTGNSGNNVLEGGDGNDALIGSGGNDTASYEHASAAVTVNLNTTTAQNTIGAGTDTLTGIANVRGSSHDDALTGNGNSMIEGGAGADQIIAGTAGQDTASYMHSQTGVTASLSGAFAGTGDAEGDLYYNIHNLFGSSHSDRLWGDNQANVLDGGYGADSGGHDLLLGLAGADRFVFRGSAVEIGDFNKAEGDKIDLQLPFQITQSQLDALIQASTGDTLTIGGTDLKIDNVVIHAQLTSNDFILHT